MLATVLVCAFTGIFGGLQIYLGQRAWPDFKSRPNPETAFMDVTRRVGWDAAFPGPENRADSGHGRRWLDGSSRGGPPPVWHGSRQGPAAEAFRLSSSSATYSHPQHLVDGMTYIGTLFFFYEQADELLNCGVFLAFMGVNLASFWQFAVVPQRPRRRRWFADAVMPLLGFAFCLWIWSGLKLPAEIVGETWFLVGLEYCTLKTRGVPGAARYDRFW